MKKSTAILWGIIFIVLGLVFGLNALGITDIDIFFDGWWTLFIIIPCAVGLVNEKEKTGNLIGVIVGVVLLLACQDVLRFDIIRKLILPVILVAIGLSVIFKNVLGSKTRKEIKIIIDKNKTEKEEYCSTFSSQNLNFDGQSFSGTGVSAVFGGIKVDLTGAVITGDVVINASAVFGGVDIIVPLEYNVKVESNSIFGGVSTKRSTKPVDGAPTVYVNATCVFGGVDIK